mgnify:CR=1 FL=1
MAYLRIKPQKCQIDDIERKAWYYIISLNQKDIYTLNPFTYKYILVYVKETITWKHSYQVYPQPHELLLGFEVYSLFSF